MADWWVGPRDFVCRYCFEDKYIKEVIKDEGKLGECGWCSRKNVKVIHLSILGPVFRDLAEIYRYCDCEPEIERGQQLGELFKEQWNIFSDEIAVKDLAQDLTVSILRSGIDFKEIGADYDGFYMDDDRWLAYRWADMSTKALKSEDVASLDTTAINTSDLQEPWTDELELAFEDLSTQIKAGAIYYRARIHKNRNSRHRFEINDLGAPPPEKARSGRANTKGVPVLYLATGKNTAIAEVRPWKGAPIAIAKVITKADLRLVDFRKLAPIESPFSVDHLQWRIKLNDLFYRLSEDLARPLGPHETEVLYKPTQYLAAYIRACKYDGIIFRSAMGSGANVVLFNPNAAELKVVAYVRLRDIAYFHNELGENEEAYDETPYDGYYPNED